MQKDNLTAQSIFDTAAIGLIAQGHQSLGPTGMCAYRGKGGAKCAAGFLIEDDEYDVQMDLMDDTSWRMVSEIYKERFCQLRPFYYLIKELQWCHDNVNILEPFHTQIAETLANIAKNYELSTKALDAALEAKGKEA